MESPIRYIYEVKFYSSPYMSSATHTNYYLNPEQTHFIFSLDEYRTGQIKIFYVAVLIDSHLYAHALRSLEPISTEKRAGSAIFT